MDCLPTFDASTVEAISKVLGEAGIGSNISNALKSMSLVDKSCESTKWKRLYSNFIYYQNSTKSSKIILEFIKEYLAPTRFVGKQDDFERYRINLNTILIFHGLEFGKDGLFGRITIANTLDEAQKRVNMVRDKLEGRDTHPEVYKYCRPELMQQNYFHAVFEACKGLFQRIRDLSGATGDGAALIDKVFSCESPKIAFNTLQTDTEKSEHKGFAQLLKGCVAAIRNPTAHLPKILWQGESDAADYLTLISLLHRKLDQSIENLTSK